jgi:hypothetical protein
MAGGFYTQLQKSTNGTTLVNADQLWRPLDIVSKLVTQDKMMKSITEGFESSATPQNVGAEA